MKTASLTLDTQVVRTVLIGIGATVIMVLVGGWAARAHGADQIPPAATKEAEEIFKTRCTTCHGADGKGDGPAAVALNPKPRDMTDKAWQKSVSDEQIDKIIVGGGAAVGKSVLMPANPDLANKPDVVKALRQIVRNFGK